jgi:hypothetical protein
VRLLGVRVAGLLGGRDAGGEAAGRAGERQLALDL